MVTKRVPQTIDHPKIIQIKVTLGGVKPPVWRRLVMRGGMHLGQLHMAIQAVMGWHDRHLHRFNIGGESYGNRRRVDDTAAEMWLTLHSLLKAGVTRFDYIYDFRDTWEHLVAFEKNEPPVAGATYPICIGGKRNCPPEECGGPLGYAELLAILADPNHPEHAQQLAWVGGAFDPEEFDLERANRVLAARFAKKRATPDGARSPQPSG